MSDGVTNDDEEGALLRSSAYSFSTHNANEGFWNDRMGKQQLHLHLPCLQIRWQHIGVAVGRSADFRAGRTPRPPTCVNHILRQTSHRDHACCFILMLVGQVGFKQMT